MRIEQWRVHQALSLIVAAALSAWPLPEWLAPWQPQWIAITIIFWVISRPGEAGYGMAWAGGMMSDLLAGNWVGVHIVSYSLIVYLCTRFHRMMQLSSGLQTILSAGLLLVLHLAYLHLGSLFIANINPGLIFWASLPASVVAWAILYPLLKKMLAKKAGLDAGGSGKSSRYG